MTARRLLAALLIALAGSGLFTFWIGKRFSKPVSAAPMKQQYVASVHNLNPGETLQKTNLTMVDWPIDNKLDGGFAKADDLVGRTVLYPLSAGAPILERQLSTAGSGLGLSTKIPDGMRAISLKTDNVMGVAGFLLPGTHVDVLVTYRVVTQENQGQPPVVVTSMVMQDAEIITAGQKMQPDPEGKPSTVDVVTLLAKPEDAERVVLASTQGSVHFILRNGSDHEHFDGAVANLSDFAPVSKTPVVVPTHRASSKPAVAANAPYTVETVAGGKQTKESFQ